MFGTRHLRNPAAHFTLAAALLLGACAPMMPPSAGGAERLEDEEVAGITQAANQGEVVTSEPARTRATSPAVRQFAERMVADHGAANQRLQELAQREGIGIDTDEDLVQQLNGNAAATVQALQGRQGADFDRTYLDAQIAMHQWTLNSLDGMLIPSTRNRALRALLTEMRATVAGHLQQAQQIRQGL